MDHGLFKHWPWVSLLAATGLSVAVFNLIMKPGGVNHLPEDQSYEMIRPESSVREYDLSGRRIVRLGEESKSPSAAAHATGAGAGQPASPVAAQPAVAAPANPVTQAHAAKQAKLKADAARKAAQARARKKAEMGVRVVGRTQSTMSGFSNTTAPGNSSVIAAPMAYATPDTPAETSSDNQVEKEKRSPGQWRSYLNAVPTAKTGQEFVAAFKAREVDEATFYNFAKEYLGDKEERYQKLGIYLLEQTPSAKSFAILVTTPEANMTSATKAQTQKTTQAYGEATRFSILNQILLTGSPVLVKRGTEILQATLQTQSNLRQNTENGNVRDARSPGSAPISATQFQIFTPSLRRLTSSPEAEIAQTAQQILETIQALKPA